MLLDSLLAVPAQQQPLLQPLLRQRAGGGGGGGTFVGVDWDCDGDSESRTAAPLVARSALGAPLPPSRAERLLLQRRLPPRSSAGGAGRKEERPYIAGNRINPVSFDQG